MSTTTAPSYIEEILDHSDVGEVAYRRIAFGLETWDITGPDDEPATIRIADDDGLIIVTLLTGGRAELESGQMTFRHNLAAPAFVASAIDQIAADYLFWQPNHRQERTPMGTTTATPEISRRHEDGTWGSFDVTIGPFEFSAEDGADREALTAWLAEYVADNGEGEWSATYNGIETDVVTTGRIA